MRAVILSNQEGPQLYQALNTVLRYKFKVLLKSDFHFSQLKPVYQSPATVLDFDLLLHFCLLTFFINKAFIANANTVFFTHSVPFTLVNLAD